MNIIARSTLDFAHSFPTEISPPCTRYRERRTSPRPSLGKRFRLKPDLTMKCSSRTRRTFPNCLRAIGRRDCRKNEASLKEACGSGCDAGRLSTGRFIRAAALCEGQSAHAMRLTRYCIASMRADHKRRRMVRKAPPRGLKRPSACRKRSRDERRRTFSAAGPRYRNTNRFCGNFDKSLLAGQRRQSC